MNEDVFPIENGDFPMSFVSFHGFLSVFPSFFFLRVKHQGILEALKMEALEAGDDKIHL